tara:strand:- start:78 stop:224 length:147 start_codon:yes stop_codon:yes gene_type:complete
LDAVDFNDEWFKGGIEFLLSLGDHFSGSFSLSLGSSLQDAVNTEGEDG